MSEKPKYYDEKSKVRTMRYMKENRDRITTWVKKGDKERYMQFADSQGKSLNALFIELIEREMRDKADG